MLDHALTVLPVWLVFVLFAAVPAAIAATLHDGFRRLVPAERLIPHHDVAGFLVAIVGLLFAVVLAFIVAAAWGSFDAAQRNADAEAAAVAEVFASANVLPDPARSQVRSLMADYAFEVRDTEWAMLAHGLQDERARALLLDAYEAVARIPAKANEPVPVAMHVEMLQQVVLSNLSNLSTQRRQRLLDVEKRVPNELYVALLFAWLILLAFVFLFGAPRALQLTMTALLTAMVGILFALVVEFDLPYGHGIRVSSEAWSYVIAHSKLASYRTER